jgi:hypothetical protein
VSFFSSFWFLVENTEVKSELVEPFGRLKPFELLGVKLSPVFIL